MLAPLLAGLLAALPAPAPSPTGAAPADTLTAADLLDVATASVADLSDDGRWAALVTTRRRDGLGVVAARTGDVTYDRLTPATLEVLDTRTLARTPVFAGARPVRGATWSPDGRFLAYFEQVDDRLRLVVWDRTTARSTVAKLPAGQYVAEGSELRWNGAGTALRFALRREAWRTAMAQRFDSLVKGPVTVLRGGDDEPFLPWEALRREGNRRAIAEWTPATQRTEVLVGERMIAQWFVSADGSVRTWFDDVSTRTDYATIMGRTERLVARVGADTTPRVLLASLRNVTVLPSEDGRRLWYAREGQVWTLRVGAAGDTARRRVLAPDSLPASDTSAAARARRARTRWTLVRASAAGDAAIVSRMDGLWLTDTAGALRKLASLPDSTDTASPRATVLAWSGDGRWIWLAANARDRWERAIVRWDRTTGATDTLVRDVGARSALATSRDGAVVTFALAQPNRPADPMVADGRLAGARALADANASLTAARLARTELVRYLDADGEPQWGVLYRPRTGSGPWPTVFLVYEQFFDDGFDGFANLLASRGYAVMKPSVRFDTGYPGEAWLKGVTAAANHLVAAGVADSARLGLQGTSYGGYATNLLVTQTRRFKAAVNVSGKVDMISFYTDSPRLGDRNTHAAEASQDRIGATLWEAPMKYVAHSAVMFADRITTPVLLVTGGEDHNVPALNTREMYYALRRLGKKVEWVNYANGGHGTPMTTAAEFTHYHTAIVAWYDRWLRARPAAATSTASVGASGTK
jgi:dipeptidyl aminopeptidase/acylaminoacyl peptidase